MGRLLPGRLAVLLLCLVAAAALALRLTFPDSENGSLRTRAEERRCHLSSNAVPSCGVLWGVSNQPTTVQHLREVERAVGRPFDFVYRYHDVFSKIPDAQERALVEGGRLLHVAIASRDFSESPARIAWADIARGKFDRTLSAQAKGIASLKVPVFVTFEQEANQKTKLGVSGDAADFVAAWRHLHDLYRSAGATNAVWTWVMTGFPGNLDRAVSLWPGNDVVDWISWNVYNQSGCQAGVVEEDKIASFDDELRPFYEFVRDRGPSLGIDRNKPMMISETGSVRYPQSPELAADWYEAIPSTLRRYPQVKAVTLWNSATDSCDYVFDRDPITAGGVRTAGLDDFLHLRGALSPDG